MAVRSAAAVLDAIGSQLVPGYSVATFEDLEKALHPIEQVLTEQPTLLVVDNMESILLPPFMEGLSAGAPISDPARTEAVEENAPGRRPALQSTDGESLAALSADMRRELGSILKLCARLNAKGETRLIFTSREVLPAPFDAPRHRRELHRLDREDAVKLVERALNAAVGQAFQPAGSPDFPVRCSGQAVGKPPAPADKNVCPTSASSTGRERDSAADAARESIEALVDAVHGHARTLALLAPELRSRGVEATRAALVELMAAMERQFPGSREKSVFASVELSLRRMSPANRDKARVLGCFTAGSIWTCSAEFNSAIRQIENLRYDGASADPHSEILSPTRFVGT